MHLFYDGGLIMKKVLSIAIALIVLVLVACTEDVNKTITSIDINDNTLENFYVVNEFDLSTIQVTVFYSDGTSETINLSEELLSDVDYNKLSTVGTHTITITFKGFSTTLVITLESMSELSSTLQHLYQLGVDADLIDMTYEEWLTSIKGEDGLDGKELSIRVAEGHIQYQYVGDTSWNNLYALIDLTGAAGIDGREVTFQVSATHIQWQYQGDEDWTNLVSLSTLVGATGPAGQDGTDGQAIQLQVTSGYIQFKYENEDEWQNLIELSSLVGAKGDDGSNGTDGREVIFQVSATHIQWQYVGDDIWIDLVPFSALMGMPGTDGQAVQLQVTSGYIQFKYENEVEWQNLIELSSLVGAKGESGKSAYEIYTEYYVDYEGTEEEWINDLINGNLQTVPNKYQVIFYNFDGAIISYQQIYHGESAVEPILPVKDGHVFVTWDNDFDLITEDIDIRPVFELEKFEIVFNSEGGTEYSTLEDVLFGTSITLPTPSKTGFYFAGWYIDDTINGLQFTNSTPVTSDLILYARWELRPFIVTFLDKDDEVIKEQFVLYGGTASLLVNPTKVGYTFVGWNHSLDNITQDIILSPIFEANTNTTYNVQYYLQSIDGLTFELFETISYIGTSDETASAFIKAYDGFDFDDTNENNILESTVNPDGSLVLTVYYLRHILEINFYDFNDELLESKNVLFGSNVVPPSAPDVSGYTFDTWDASLLNITENTDVYPIYVANTYHLTLDVNSGNEIENDTLEIIYHSNINGLSIPTRDGYTFVDWKDQEDNTYQNGDVYSVASDLTLYANWLANDATYTVNHYKENQDGTYTLFESETLDGATDLIVSVVLKAYVGYVYNENHEDNMDEGIVTNDNSLVLSVYYALEMFTVNFVDHNDTLIDSQAVKYLNDALAPDNPTRTGYTFIEWDTAFKAVTTDLIVKAVYQMNTYTLTFDTDGGNSISSITADFNSVIDLPIPVKEYHNFTGWLLNDQLVTELYLTENLTVTATWQLKDYFIHLNTSDGDELEDIIVQYGTVVSELPTPTRLDYTFDGWTLDGNPVVLPYTFLGNADIEFVAVWIGLSSGILYEISNDEVTVLSYQGIETNLIIPDTIAGLPVTTIGSGAFSGNTTIVSLVLGQYVTTIENQAFYQMTNLTYLELSASTQTFGTQVLFGSNSLEHLVLSSESNYQLRYYFGNNINFIPTTLHTLELADDSAYINVTLTQNNLGSVTSILIPETIDTIPEQAFQGANSLTSIVIPDSITSIGVSAFRGASSLESITLPFVGSSRSATGSNVQFGHIFGTTSYTGSYNANGYYIPNTLTEVIITDSTSIGASAFYGVSSLTSIVIPNGVTSIVFNAFYGTSSLTSIVIPNSVTSIGSNAFMYSGLESIVFESDSKLTNIADGTFFGASSLTSIVIPNSVTNIGASAFFGASSLTSIVIPNSITNIGASAFFGASSLTSIVIPNSVTNIESNAFQGASSLESITLPFVGQSRSATGVNAQFGYIFGATIYTDSYAVFRIGGGNLYLPNTLTEVIITDAIHIRSAAFQGASSLASIVIPNSVTNIESQSFRGTSNLTNITLPFVGQFSNVQGDLGLFGYIFGTTSYTGSYNANGYYIPNTLKAVTITNAGYITYAAFRGVSSLESITLPFVGESRTATGAYARFGHIFGSVSYIGSYIANGMYLPLSLTEVVITDTISIDNSAFSGATSLTSIVLPNGITSIGSNAFSGTSSLTSIVIPNSVTNIGSSAFQNSGLETVIFEDNSSLTNIGTSVFAGNFNLTSIVIPNSVTSIGNSAFSGATSLTSIVIPKSVVSIGSSAFSGTSNLTSVTFEDNSFLTSIGSSAFSGSNNVKSIVIPNSIIHMGSNVFNNQSTAIYTNLNTKPIGWESNWVSNNTVIWGYEQSIEHNGIGYALSSNNVAYVIGATETIDSNVIIEGYINGYEVIEIVSNAFRDNLTMESVFIPNTIMKIGYHAFSAATNLTTIEFEEFSQLTTIGNGVFSGASSLGSIIIPKSVTNIGSEAFSGASSLTIFSETESQPTGWHSNWNPLNRPVIWGSDGTIEITVNGGYADNNMTHYNSVVTITSTTEGFVAWQENGQIVSYNPIYKFTALFDRELTAITEGEEQPLVVIHNVVIREDMISYLGQIHLPEGFSILEFGFIFADIDFNFFNGEDGVTTVPSIILQPTTNEYLRSFAYDDSFNVIKAYVILSNGEVTTTYYSDVLSKSIE